MHEDKEGECYLRIMTPVSYQEKSRYDHQFPEDVELKQVQGKSYTIHSSCKEN